MDLTLAFTYTKDGKAAELHRQLKAMSAVNLDQASSDRRCTLLYTAARLGHLDCALVLLCGCIGGQVADVNKMNEGTDKSLPIHGACYGGHPAIVALLMQCGAFVGKKNGHGETPQQNAETPSAGTNATKAKKCAELLRNPAEAKKVLVSELQSNPFVKALQMEIGRPLMIPGLTAEEHGWGPSQTKKRGRA